MLNPLAASDPMAFGRRKPGRDYLQTNRGLDWLKLEYPPDMLDLKDLRQHSVADICTGHGQLVYELRQRGVHAVGVDRHVDETKILTELRQRKPAAKAENVSTQSGQHQKQRLTDFLRHLLAGDARELPLADHWSGRTYHSYGPLSFDDEKPAVKKDVLKELVRVTQPGGRIRLLPVRLAEVKALLRSAGLVRKTEIVQYNPKPPRLETEELPSWLELERKH